MQWRPSGGFAESRYSSSIDISLPTSSGLLSRLGRPLGFFDAELLCVLGVQPGPAELHGLASNDSADRASTEKQIHDIQTDVPSSGAHRNEAAIDVVP